MQSAIVDEGGGLFSTPIALAFPNNPHGAKVGPVLDRSFLGYLQHLQEELWMGNLHLQPQLAFKACLGHGCLQENCGKWERTRSPPAC